MATDGFEQIRSHPNVLKEANFQSKKPDPKMV
jgi:hypothetical protein